MAARFTQRHYDNIQFRWAPGREGDTLQAVGYRMTWRGSISETLGNFWVDTWAYLYYKPGESRAEAMLGPRRGVWTVRRLDDESKNTLAAFMLLRAMRQGVITMIKKYNNVEGFVLGMILAGQAGVFLRLVFMGV